MKPSVRVEQQVMFHDTDCGGVVHNTAYLRFVENARVALLNGLGFPIVGMMESRVFPAVTRAEIDYRRPAMLGDILQVSAELESFDRVRFWCAFAIHRGGELLSTCRQRIVLVKLPEGRPCPTPDSWREAHGELRRERLE